MLPVLQELGHDSLALPVFSFLSSIFTGWFRKQKMNTLFLVDPNIVFLNDKAENDYPQTGLMQIDSLEII